MTPIIAYTLPIVLVAFAYTYLFILGPITLIFSLIVGGLFLFKEHHADSLRTVANVIIFLGAVNLIVLGSATFVGNSGGMTTDSSVWIWFLVSASAPVIVLAGRFIKKNESKNS